MTPQDWEVLRTKILKGLRFIAYKLDMTLNQVGYSMFAIAFFIILLISLYFEDAIYDKKTRLMLYGMYRTKQRDQDIEWERLEDELISIIKNSKKKPNLKKIKKYKKKIVKTTSKAKLNRVIWYP